jgi:hypothetical protein
MSKLLLIVLASTSLCNCVTSTFASMPGVTAPVLLSGTDRMGGGAPLPATPQGSLDVQADKTIAVSTSRYGNVQVTTSVATWTGKLDFTKQALESTESFGRAGEIRITQLRPGAWASSWVFLLGGSLLREAYVILKGDVVRVEGVAP